MHQALNWGIHTELIDDIVTCFSIRLNYFSFLSDRFHIVQYSLILSERLYRHDHDDIDDNNNNWKLPSIVIPSVLFIINTENNQTTFANSVSEVRKGCFQSSRLCFNTIWIATQTDPFPSLCVSCRRKPGAVISLNNRLQQKRTRILIRLHVLCCNIPLWMGSLKKQDRVECTDSQSVRFDGGCGGWRDLLLKVTRMGYYSPVLLASSPSLHAWL